MKSPCGRWKKNRRQKKEWLAVIDKNDGRVLLLKEGEIGRVIATPDEEAKMRGNVVTHNHTGETSFSAGDLLAWIRVEPAIFRIVLPSGAVYSLFPPKEGFGADFGKKVVNLLFELRDAYDGPASGYEDYKDNGIVADIIKRLVV